MAAYHIHTDQLPKKAKEITNCRIVEKDRTGTIVNHSYINKRLKEMIGSYVFKALHSQMKLLVSPTGNTYETEEEARIKKYEYEIRK